MSPTDAPSHELARFVVDQLREVVPVSLELEADGPDVVVRFELHEGRNSMATILDDEDRRSFDDRLAAATRAVLDHVQDAAATASGAPWPAIGSVMPLPAAEVVDGRLRAWFGDRAAPALALEEIDTSTLCKPL